MFFFFFFFTQQIHPAVLKTGHRHGLEIGGHEEYVKNQFAPACSNAGEDEVHYLNDEYIPKIALLQAFWNANISAQSNGKKNATRPAWPTVTCKDLDESCLSC